MKFNTIFSTIKSFIQQYLLYSLFFDHFIFNRGGRTFFVLEGQIRKQLFTQGKVFLLFHMSQTEKNPYHLQSIVMLEKTMKTICNSFSCYFQHARLLQFDLLCPTVCFIDLGKLNLV